MPLLWTASTIAHLFRLHSKPDGWVGGWVGGIMRYLGVIQQVVQISISSKDANNKLDQIQCSLHNVVHQTRH